MLYAFATMLSCQLAGEVFVRALALAVPGPVVGMILLAALMVLKAPLPSELGDTADGLLQHLDRLGSEGVRLLAVVVFSTAITLAVTALVFAGVARLMGRRAEDDGLRERP
ncbi:MAG: CidA/LrgA family protein [Rhodoplanes sp.]